MQVDLRRPQITVLFARAVLGDQQIRLYASHISFHARFRIGERKRERRKREQLRRPAVEIVQTVRTVVDFSHTHAQIRRRGLRKRRIERGDSSGIVRTVGRFRKRVEQSEDLAFVTRIKLIPEREHERRKGEPDTAIHTTSHDTRAYSRTARKRC